MAPAHPCAGQHACICSTQDTHATGVSGPQPDSAHYTSTSHAIRWVGTYAISAYPGLLPAFSQQTCNQSHGRVCRPATYCHTCSQPPCCSIGCVRLAACTTSGPLASCTMCGPASEGRTRADHKHMLKCRGLPALMLA